MLQKIKSLLSLVNLVPTVAVATAATIGFQLSTPVLEPVVFPEKPEIVASEPASAIKTGNRDGQAEAEQLVAQAVGNFTDGTFYGSGQGFSGLTKVEVIVENGQIVTVNILSTKDDTSFFNRAKSGVVDAILKAQTWEVDSVTGATYSSRGIKEAVKNAVTGSNEVSSSPPAGKASAKTLKSSKFEMGTLKDGTFTGSAKGFGGTIKVSVSISGGKITAIKVTSHSGETESYFSKAKKIISRIIKAQSPNVDTVSGATYSSNGIREAVKNALKKAAGETVKDEPERETDDSEKDESQMEEEVTIPEGLPANGSFTAEARCQMGQIFDYAVTVTAVYLDGVLQNVTITTTDTGENSSFIDKAWKVLQKALLTKEISEIDTVSGATYTSKAVLNAYRSAYKQAVEANGGTLPDHKDEDENPQEEPSKEDNTEESGDQSEEENTIPEGLPANGCFTAEARCQMGQIFDYAVTVTADYLDGILQTVTMSATDSGTNQRYIDKAWSVLEGALLTYNYNEIDTVSGATYTSKAVLSAYRSTYKQAVEANGGTIPDDEEETEQDKQPDTPTEDDNHTDNEDSSDTEDEPAEQPVQTVYEVSGMVYCDESEDFWDYGISASVTFVGEKFVSMVLHASTEDSINLSYLDMAEKAILPQLIKKQSAEVDMVSGATCSSKGIIELYKEAKKLADTALTAKKENE